MRVFVLRRVVVVAGSVALALLAAGCTSNERAPRVGTGTTVAAAPLPDPAPLPGLQPSALPDPQPTPRPHLADAVRDLLAAEQRSDRAGSFLLLSRRSRDEYVDVADWTARRQELPAITGFSIDPGSEGEGGDRSGTVVAVVEHLPGLDPFKGLSAARETQTFSGTNDGEGWLVDGDPAVERWLPPDQLAVESAASWVAAVQACDQPKALELQAVSTLFGSAEGAVGLCGKQGRVEPASVERLRPGEASTDIVAQYSTDALSWARVVEITSPAAFSVVLAPLGDDWRVLGLSD